MLTVVQRVSEAWIIINEQITGKIERGLLIFCGFEMQDTEATLQRMLEKCLNYRIFNDEKGKMNHSLKEMKGGLLLVPQFTLMADTQKGLRPSFSKAAPPAQGRLLFEQLIHLACEKYSPVASGQFGADMQIHLCNEGPVTFLLQF
ncbi:D-aminoacyl-tRNA deacylase [Legionella fairfieldensis]|uniref:D-aminoacyl-tRNA deacylase n=1 Tax=Legionella fairfieldensis TaxID=45064 RepID=UPI00048D955D|nr:D-aminoacyl-tRNA deacylase [Legionella fairfieldensis]